jgi:hypothetical protein
VAFLDVVYKIVCGFVPKPGKVKVDGGGLDEPGRGLAYPGYLKGFTAT